MTRSKPAVVTLVTSIAFTFSQTALVTSVSLAQKTANPTSTPVPAAPSTERQQLTGVGPTSTAPKQTEQQTLVPPPVGTAAAPEMKAEGTPASAPAGAAIAPARQRRAKSFSVRVALLVGAVVAVGIVAGAALASPSSSH